MVARPITPSTVDAPAVRSGASAIASTASLTAPISSATSRRYVWPIASAMPFRVWAAKPGASAVSA